MILVDTNVALRILQLNHAHYQVAVDAVNLLRTRDHEAFSIAPQSIYETFVVATRPLNVNGFGKSSHEAMEDVVRIKTIFALIPETPHVYSTWEFLIGKYNVVGKRAHDIRLAAIMITRRIPAMLTFNDGRLSQRGRDPNLESCLLYTS